MTYTLVKAKWSIGMIQNHAKPTTIEVKYSLHLTEEDFTNFLKKQVIHGLHQKPSLLYHTEGVTVTHHVNGNLYNEVKQAKEEVKIGARKTIEELK